MQPPDGALETRNSLELSRRQRGVYPGRQDTRRLPKLEQDAHVLGGGNRPIAGSVDVSTAFAFRSFAISPDGRLVTAGGNEKAVVWDRAARQPYKTFAYPEIIRLACSSDGKTLAATQWHPSGATGIAAARVWDWETGKERLAVQGSNVYWGAIALSPDNTILAIGCGDESTARLYSLATGKLLHTLPHDSRVIDLAFSPDGKTLATAGWSGSGSGIRPPGN